MVASTDIKFYMHTNNNAPQLQNAYGSMINVLDACLINGINIGTVSSLTASGTTVTATFSTTHNLMQYQVIKITGAAQSEFNGEHRILTVPNAQSVTFELAVAPSTSTTTGTINASLPPLGWEKPFGNTGGKAAYRSANLLLPSRPFLRVVDELDPTYTATYAKYAKVGIVEDMTDIDTMLGVQAPYDSANPGKNWVGTGTGSAAINGWSKWYYAKSTREMMEYAASNDVFAPENGNRAYLIVGDKNTFYFLPCVVNNNNHALCYGFGAFNTFLDVDSASNFLSSSLRYAAASADGRSAQFIALGSSSISTLLLQRRSNQVDAYTSARISSLETGVTPMRSGLSNYITNTKTPFFPLIINEATVIRGELPIVKWLLKAKPFADLKRINSAGRLFIAKNIHADHDGNTAPHLGQVVFDLGES